MLGTLVSLICVEVGIALVYLFRYKKSSYSVSSVLKHLWGVVTTFLVFFVVNLESTYPKILVKIATIYELPLLLFAILVLIKNSFVTFSYFVEGEKKQKIFLKIYSISTIISAYLVVSVLASALNGFSVNLANSSVNFLMMLINPIGIIAFFAVGILSIASLHKKFFMNLISPFLVIILTLLAGIVNYSFAFGGKVNLLTDIATSPAIIISTIVVAVLGYLLIIGVLFLEKKIQKK